LPAGLIVVVVVVVVIILQSAYSLAGPSAAAVPGRGGGGAVRGQRVHAPVAPRQPWPIKVTRRRRVGVCV